MTDQTRRAIGADLSAPFTHEEVEKLMEMDGNNPQRRRRGKAKQDVRGATLVRSRREQSGT